jgi:hypothetical protein
MPQLPFRIRATDGGPYRASRGTTAASTPRHGCSRRPRSSTTGSTFHHGRLST